MCPHKTTYNFLHWVELAHTHPPLLVRGPLNGRYLVQTFVNCISCSNVNFKNSNPTFYEQKLFTVQLSNKLVSCGAAPQGSCQASF